MGLTERVVARFRGTEPLPSAGDTQQRDLAMVELMVLAMHADRHETAVEEAMVREFCATRAWDPPLDAEAAFDEAVSTVADAMSRDDGVAQLFESMCVRLGDAGAQQFALTEIAETMLSDGTITVGEMEFVDRLRARFAITRVD